MRNGVRCQNQLSRPNMPSDPGISQQPLRQISEGQQAQHGNKNQITDRRHEPAAPTQRRNLLMAG